MMKQVETLIDVKYLRLDYEDFFSPMDLSNLLQALSDFYNACNKMTMKRYKTPKSQLKISRIKEGSLLLFIAGDPIVLESMKNILFSITGAEIHRRMVGRLNKHKQLINSSPKSSAENLLSVAATTDFKEIEFVSTNSDGERTVIKIKK